jgi:flagellar hook assembly protein FlgD
MLSLPVKSELDIRVYDVRGRLVRLLAKGSRDPGRHVLSWDGTDAGGRAAGAGVYFVQATAGTFSKNVRCVLVR